MDRVRFVDVQRAILCWQLGEILLRQFANFGERRQAARYDLTIAHDGPKLAQVAIGSWLLCQLDDILFPAWMAVNLLLAGPGALGTRQLHLREVCTRLIHVGDLFIDRAERSAIDMMFKRASTTAQRGPDAERVDGRSCFEQLCDTPFVQVSTCQNADTLQTRIVELLTNIEAVAKQISAIQAYSSQCMAERLLRT